MKLPEISIQKILYATDLTESASNVLAYAVHLANTFQASITILHVLYKKIDVEPFMVFHIGYAEWARLQKQMYDNARNALINKKRENADIKEVLYQFAERAKKDSNLPAVVTDEIVVERGDPADIILDQAEKHNCDFIVMGLHEQEGLAKALIGSTTRRVLKRTRKPVFVVPLPASP